MTCIVGIAANGKVWMGGDTCASDRISHIQIKHPKVFTLLIPVEGSKEHEIMVVGGSGSFRMMQILEHAFNPPPIHKNQSIMSYLTVDFCDKLRDLFAAKGVHRKGKELDSFGGTIMIGFRGELFHLEDSYTLVSAESNEFASGSGADFAMGSLFTSRRSSWTPKERILEALETAAHFNMQTKGPFDILSI